MKVFYLDKNCERRTKKAREIREYWPDLLLTDIASISRQEYEIGTYDIVLIHKNNDEADDIEEREWDSGDAKIVLFSGGFPSKLIDDGIIYIPERSIISFLSEELAK